MDNLESEDGSSISNNNGDREISVVGSPKNKKEVGKTRLVNKFLAKEIACMATDLRLNRLWLPDSWSHNFPSVTRLHWDLACWEFIREEGMNWKSVRSRVTFGVRQLRQLSRLTNLTLSRCELLDDEAMGHVGALTGLKKLHLQGGELLTAAGVAELRSLEDLTDLSFDSCYRLSNSAILELKPHTTLRNLALRGSRHLSDSGLAPLAALVNLESLDLSDNPSIDGTGLAEALRPLAKLSTLKLSNCRRLFQSGENFMSAVPNVTDLDISCCDLVSDSSVAALRSCLPRLSTINLGGCHNFRNRALASLAYLESLTSLNLEGSNALRDNGLALIQSFPKLTHLNISSCKNISDVGLACLASQTNLRDLRLDNCNNISDPGVATLSNLKNLEIFSADGSRHVTWLGVAFLRNNIKGLTSTSPLEPARLSVPRSTI
jgi:hypothetical protein